MNEQLDTTVLQKRSGKDALFLNVPMNVKNELDLESGMKCEWVGVPSKAFPFIILRVGWSDEKKD